MAYTLEYRTGYFLSPEHVQYDLPQEFFFKGSRKSGKLGNFFHVSKRTFSSN